MSAAGWPWISSCLVAPLLAGIPLRLPLGLRHLAGTAVIVVGPHLMFPG